MENLWVVLRKASICSHGIELIRLLRKWVDNETIEKAFVNAIDAVMLIDALLLGEELLKRDAKINDNFKIKLASWALSLKLEDLAKIIVSKINDWKLFFEEDNFRYLSSSLINYYIASLVKRKDWLLISEILDKIVEKKLFWLDLAESMHYLRRKKGLKTVLSMLDINTIANIIFLTAPFEKEIIEISKFLPETTLREFIENIYELTKKKRRTKKLVEKIKLLKNLISEDYFSLVIEWLRKYEKRNPSLREIINILEERVEKLQNESSLERSYSNESIYVAKREDNTYRKKKCIESLLLKENLKQFLRKNTECFEFLIFLLIMRGKIKLLRKILSGNMHGVNFGELVNYFYEFKRLLPNLDPTIFVLIITEFWRRKSIPHLLTMLRIIPEYYYRLGGLRLLARRLRKSIMIKDLNYLLQLPMPAWLRAIFLASEKSNKMLRYIVESPDIFPYLLLITPRKAIKLLRKSDNKDRLLLELFSNPAIMYLLRKDSKRTFKTVLKVASNSNHKSLRITAKIILGAAINEHPILDIFKKETGMSIENLEKIRRYKGFLGFLPLILPEKDIEKIVGTLINARHVYQQSINLPSYGVPTKPRRIVGYDDLAIEIMASPFLSDEFFERLLKIVLEKKTFDPLLQTKNEELELINIFDRRSFLAKLVEKIIISLGYYSADRVINILMNCRWDERDSVIIVIARYGYIPSGEFLKKLMQIEGPSKYYCFLAELLRDGLLMNKIRTEEIKKNLMKRRK